MTPETQFTGPLLLQRRCLRPRGSKAAPSPPVCFLSPPLEQIVWESGPDLHRCSVLGCQGLKGQGARKDRWQGPEPQPGSLQVHTGALLTKTCTSIPGTSHQPCPEEAPTNHQRPTGPCKQEATEPSRPRDSGLERCDGHHPASHKRDPKGSWLTSLYPQPPHPTKRSWAALTEPLCPQPRSASPERESKPACLWDPRPWQG